ncbi:MAG: hypothetical protein AAFY78_07760 [Cyanobacteria bacterium J06648_16]
MGRASDRASALQGIKSLKFVHFLNPEAIAAYLQQETTEIVAYPNRRQVESLAASTDRVTVSGAVKTIAGTDSVQPDHVL